MTNRLEGKTALITGAARGQGRAHAVRMAEEGANILALDICGQMESVPYDLATADDLAETERLVVEAGRKIVTIEGDVRNRGDIADAVRIGIEHFGRLDVVVANAGIWPAAMGDPRIGDLIDAIDVDLVGVINTVAAALPHLTSGSSIIVIGSTAAMMPGAADNPIAGPGAAGYGYAKRALVAYSEHLALQLAPHMIRVNAIHPTNVNTDLLHNAGIYQLWCPDLDTPTREHADARFPSLQAMPIPYLEPIDVANLAVFLASDESRYLTGQQIRLDAGSLLKHPSGPPHRQ